MPLWIERGIISTILKLCHYTTDQFLPPEPLLWCLTDGCVMSPISSRLPMSCPLGGIFCPGFQPRMNWGAASAAAKDTKKHYHQQHQIIRTSHSWSLGWGPSGDHGTRHQWQGEFFNLSFTFCIFANLVMIRVGIIGVMVWFSAFNDSRFCPISPGFRRWEEGGSGEEELDMYHTTFHTYKGRTSLVYNSSSSSWMLLS